MINCLFCPLHRSWKANSATTESQEESSYVIRNIPPKRKEVPTGKRDYPHDNRPLPSPTGTKVFTKQRNTPKVETPPLPSPKSPRFKKPDSGLYDDTATEMSTKQHDYPKDERPPSPAPNHPSSRVKKPDSGVYEEADMKLQPMKDQPYAVSTDNLVLSSMNQPSGYENTLISSNKKGKNQKEEYESMIIPNPNTL